MRKRLRTVLIILVGLLSVCALGFGQIIERPAKPVSRNAGRIIKLSPSVLIEDVGGEYFFKNPRIIKMAPDGTRYEAPGSEYMEDVSGLYVYRQVVWATTSTRAKEKGVYVDVFDQEGRYVDAFWLKLDGLLLGISGDIVFVLEKNEDETLRITGFRVVGNEPTGIIQ
jgi:hypothetical protein